jgi:O-antigen/teichoic acid export membrane protein
MEATRSDDSLSKRLIRNTLWNQVALLFRMLSMLIVLRYVVSRLGTAQTGIYFLALSFTGYFGILDASLSPPLIKLVAEFKAKGADEDISSVFRAAFRVYVAGGAIAAIVLWTASEAALFFLKIPVELHGSASATLKIAAITALLTIPLTSFDHVLRGWQRYDLVSIVSLGVSVSSFAGQLLAAKFGLGAPGLMATTGACLLAGGLVSRSLARKKAPPIALRLGKVRTAWKRLASFAGVLFAISLTDLFIYHVDRVVAAVFAGIQAVTIYEYAASLHKVPRDIHTMVVAAITPAASELEAQGQRDRLVAMLVEASRYVVAIVVPVATAIVALSPAIARSWAPPEALAPIAIYVAYWILNANTGVIANVLVGIGKLRLLLAYAYAIALSNLALSLILARKFGVSGVVAGTTLTYVIGFPFFMYFSLRATSTPINTYLRRVFWPTYPLAGVLGIFLFALSQPLKPAHNFVLVVAAGGAGVACFYGTFALLALDREERERFIRALPFGDRIAPILLRRSRPGHRSEAPTELGADKPAPIGKAPGR